MLGTIFCQMTTFGTPTLSTSILMIHPGPGKNGVETNKFKNDSCVYRLKAGSETPRAINCG